MTALAGKVDPPRLMDWLLTVQARIPRRLEQKQPPYPSLISHIVQREILAHNAPACDLTDPPRASTCRVTCRRAIYQRAHQTSMVLRNVKLSAPPI